MAWLDAAAPPAVATALLLAVLGTPPALAARSPPARPGGRVIDVAAWLAWGPVELGCWLERAHGYRDPHWNCQTPRPAPGRLARCDPRRHDGPQIPDEVARRLHPLLAQVELTWEDGALQEAVFSFAPGASVGEMRAALGVAWGRIDGAASDGPADCEGPCYDVVAFDADDAGCGEDGDDVGGSADR